MPFRQTPTTHTPYVIIAFDKNGAERTDDPDGIGGQISRKILNELQQSPPTDLFVFSHGWQGDMGAAISQYDHWIDALEAQTADIGKMGSNFRAARIGLHWPSKPWGDEAISSVGAGPAFDVSATPARPGSDTLIEQYLDRLDLSGSLRGRELLGFIFREFEANPAPAKIPSVITQAYNELARLIGYQPEAEGELSKDSGVSFDAQASFSAMNSPALSFSGGGPLGGILGPLSQFSFWMMKQRARSVGEGGMFQLVGQAQRIAANMRVHLVGHSFGCIVVSSIAAGPKGNTPLPRPIDSLTLLQGALSMWAYADAIQGTGKKGYYNNLIHRPAVRGPILTTRSAKDLAVNIWYPSAVGLVLQDPSFGVQFAVNPELITWGAIGAWGIQGLVPKAQDMKMLPETADYHFDNGRIYNLEATQYIAKMQGASGAHSDIAEPAVMHALWQSVFAVASAPAARGFAESSAAAAGAGSAAVVSEQPPAPPPVSPVSHPAPAVIVKPPVLSDKDSPLPFGVDLTGTYLPPVDPAALNRVPRDSRSVRARSAATFGVEVGVNPDDLSDAGWGIVFASNADPAEKQAIRQALKPLIDLRQEQAKGKVKIFDGPSAYNAGQTAEVWLSQNGGGMFPVVPDQGVPYYLMLVGPPDEIPFEIQYTLDIFYAVGRLCFRTPEEYATYASNVARFEKGTTLQNRTLALFNTRNLGDVPTAMLHDSVALTLLNGTKGIKPLGEAFGYSTVSKFADDATKAELTNLLRSQPALLYTGSHGVGFSGSPSQLDNQGALLTQDWQGGQLTFDMMFTGADVPADAKTLGMIHYMFACYGAGCPQFDTYTGSADKGTQIANSTFVARLPQKLLLSGAQAVIGHIDRAFAYSFQNDQGTAMAQGFHNPIGRILSGQRVGDAMDAIDQRWTALSSSLLDMLSNREAFPNGVPDTLLANRWVARDDARNYIVLGDPAVKLRPVPPASSLHPTPAPSSVATATGSVPSFGISFAAPAAPSVAPDFAVHLDQRPPLKFKDFIGAISLKAAVSPDCSFQLVEGAMQQAGNGADVDAYIYSVSSPPLMNLLKSAVDRGSRIRLMYDPAQMPASAANTLRSFGIDVKVAPSHDPRRVFTVCHQKFIVIGGNTVIVESANWDKSSIPPREAGGKRIKGNREWVILAEHDGLAEWYSTLFEADWNIPAMPAFGLEFAPPEAPVSFRGPAHPDAPSDFPVTAFTRESLTISPLTSPDNYLNSVLPLIQSARQRVWLQQQYIEGKSGPAVPRLLDAVAKRRAAGVDVRIIVSSKFPSGWDQTKDTLAEAGLSDLLRAINLDNFVHCHNKGVIVDDSVVVASTNWSENSITRAREAGMLIHSAAVTDYYAGVFEDDWDKGWSVSTADSQAKSFSVEVGQGDEDAAEVSPADRDM